MVSTRSYAAGQRTVSFRSTTCLSDDRVEELLGQSPQLGKFVFGQLVSRFDTVITDEAAEPLGQGSFLIIGQFAGNTLPVNRIRRR